MIIVALVGVLISLSFVVHFGWRTIASSLATLGVGGFVVFCVYTLGVLALLGSAWFVISPGLPIRHLPAFIFGRLMRESAADTLPFSQLGGFVIGVRATTLLGAPPTVLIASQIIDLGAEMVGQLLFTALGVELLWQHEPTGFPHQLVDPILAIGLGGGVITTALFIFSQRTGLRLLERLSTRWPPAIKSQLSLVRSELQGLYRHPLRLLSAVIVHSAAWIAATGGVWLILWIMGSPLRLSAVIALESLIYILRSVAFAVPGAIGVLEGGYVLLGPVFGLKPELALSLSLIKRGRDLAIGVPALLGWQLLEGRRLMRARLAKREAAELPSNSFVE